MGRMWSLTTSSSALILDRHYHDHLNVHSRYGLLLYLITNI